MSASLRNPAHDVWCHTCDAASHDYYKFSSGSIYLRFSTALRAPATLQFSPSCRIPRSDFPSLSFSLSLLPPDSPCRTEEKDEDEVSPAYTQFRQPNPQDDSTPPRVLSVRSAWTEELSPMTSFPHQNVGSWPEVISADNTKPVRLRSIRRGNTSQGSHQLTIRS